MKRILIVSAVVFAAFLLLVNPLSAEEQHGPPDQEPAQQPAGEEVKKPKKDNPFAKYNNEIAKIEEKIKKLDSIKDANKISNLQKSLDKAMDNKEKALNKMIKPLETKMDDLDEKANKLRDKKGDPNQIAKLDAEVRKLDAQITELNDMASGDPAEEDPNADPNAPADDAKDAKGAAEKGKGALKNM